MNDRLPSPKFPLAIALVMIWVLACQIAPESVADETDKNHGNAPELDRLVADSIDTDTASRWAQLVLKGIDTEFPTKMTLVYTDPEQIRRPRDAFPAFYGSFDWHSSVHGHWLLVRLMRTFPDLPESSRIRSVLDRHLSAENLKKEATFFGLDEQKTFERMYGWSWYLRFVMELDSFDTPHATRWRENAKPLEDVLVSRIIHYLPLLTYPIRTGQHTDTGFALGQIIDYARFFGNRELESLAVRRAKHFYEDDTHYPLQYEPSGHDFFSSGWNEADLMRRVLKQDQFVQWFGKFVPEIAKQLGDGTVQPVQVSDITDGKLVHLAGLNLNRAWCMRAIAESLPTRHELKAKLTDSANRHQSAGLGYINSGSYEGDHWLATFGLYAATQTAATQTAATQHETTQTSLESASEAK